MTARQPLYTLSIHGGIVLAAIITVGILGYHGTLDGQSVVAILGAAIGFAGGSASSLGSLNSVVNGKSILTSQQIAEQGATQRTAIVASAASEAHHVEPVAPGAQGPPENDG